ncbi:unnamed protein product [Urochloa humidicola]
MAAPAAPVAPPGGGHRLDFDVIVVGAGIMGSCAAHAAASRGARALLLERFDLLHGLGSSHGESRTIRDAYPDARYPPMVRLASRLWADAEAESGGRRVLTPTPLLSLGPRSSAEVLASIRNAAGAEEVDDLSARWGGAFRVPDGWVAAVSDRGSGVLNATEAVKMFQELAAKNGAVVRDNTEVVGIRKGPEGRGVVVTTSADEEFRGAKCVVTVGAWTSKLLKSFAGVELPIQPLHTMVLYWRIKPGHERDLTAEAGFPTFSSYWDPYHVYSTPSLERPGMIKINCHGGPPCDPDSRDFVSGGGDVAEQVARWIDEFMPGCVETAGGPVESVPCVACLLWTLVNLPAPGSKLRRSILLACGWMLLPGPGSSSQAATKQARGDFVIDFLGGEFGEDVVIGAGFSGHGFKMGPAVGRIQARR